MHPQLCAPLATRSMLAEQVYHYKGDAKRILGFLHPVTLDSLEYGVPKSPIIKMISLY